MHNKFPVAVAGAANTTDSTDAASAAVDAADAAVDGVTLYGASVKASLSYCHKL